MTHSFKITKEDWLASLLVFFVALPLSLGIAIASGHTPLAGLLSAAIGGIVVGFFSGAPLMVAGPAAGLTVLIYEVIQEYGIDGLAAASLASGILQLLLGYMRLGKWFKYIPKGVLQGMLAAIGLIILIGQLHALIGQPVPKNPVTGLLVFPEVLLNGFSENFDVTFITTSIGVFTITFQVLWKKIAGPLKWLPGALPAVVLATLISLFFHVTRVNFSEFTFASAIPDPKHLIQQLEFHGFALLGWSIVIAIVASAESLLSAQAVDLLAEEKGIKSESDLNKEIKAQGWGNIVAGIFRVIPVTGVIVRSSVNIEAGAKTRWSTILHGCWVLLFVIFLPVVLKSIPITVLAAVLVVTGYHLSHPRHFVALAQKDRLQCATAITTTVAIIGTDLLIGLSCGIAFYLGALLFIRQFLNKKGTKSQESLS